MVFVLSRTRQEGDFGLSVNVPPCLLGRGFPMEGGTTPMENLRFPTGPSPHPTGNPPPSAYGWKTHAFPTATEAEVAAAFSVNIFQNHLRAQRMFFADAFARAVTSEKCL